MKKILTLILCLLLMVLCTPSIAQVQSSLEIQVVNGSSKMQSTYTGLQDNQTTVGSTTFTTTGSSYYNGASQFGGYAGSLSQAQTLTGDGSVAFNQQTVINYTSQYGPIQVLPGSFTHNPVTNNTVANAGINIQLKNGGMAQTNLATTEGIKLDVTAGSAPGGVGTYDINTGYKETIIRVGVPPVEVTNYQMSASGTGNIQFKFQYTAKTPSPLSLPPVK